MIPLVRRASPESQILFDNHNAEAALQLRAFLTDLRQPSRWPVALYSLVQAHRLRRYEAWACHAANWLTLVSEADHDALRPLLSHKRVSVIPNCIDVAQYQIEQDKAAPCFDVVFSGKMDYRPNVDAVLWFAREIWPRILEERPHTTWAIVGQKPDRRLAPLKNARGVTVTGRVEGIQPYLAGAKVVVLPLRMGSGTRLKMIEAMAAGKAIVSTRLGAEGFALVDNEHLLLADSPAAFAAAVIRLLQQPAMRAHLASAAAQFALAYDWRRVTPRFEEVYAHLIG
jgi:glycosyltransferase involved in cell wall biosynthesis